MSDVSHCHVGDSLCRPDTIVAMVTTLPSTTRLLKNFAVDHTIYTDTILATVATETNADLPPTAL